MAPGAPPPAAMASPLMATLRGDARNATTSATSAAVMMRPTLMPAARLASASASGLPFAAAYRAIIAGGRSGAGRAGGNHRDGDPCRTQFVGQGLGQRGDCDVPDRARRRAHAAGGQATDVDDPAPPLGGHVRGGGPGAAQVAEDLGVDGREQV